MAGDKPSSLQIQAAGAGHTELKQQGKGQKQAQGQEGIREELQWLVLGLLGTLASSGSQPETQEVLPCFNSSLDTRSSLGLASKQQVHIKMELSH